MRTNLPCRALICALTVFALLATAQTGDKRVVPADGSRRLALVIGNQDYTTGRLANTIQDAETVAAALRQAGFGTRDVTVLKNLRDIEMRNAVRQFTATVRPGDVVFVYYSGHGVEIRGSNYLLPVNLPNDATEDWAEDEAVSAQKILESLDRAGARVRVLVLDACRDNPLRPKNKSVKSGLGGMEGAGALVLFATAAGSTAKDNGIFARELAAALPRPGVSLDDAFKIVARDVIRLTDRKQIPAIYGLLEEDVVLVSGSAPVYPPVTIDRGLRPGQVKLNEKDGQRYVWIPPGKFTMGCSPGDTRCLDDEKPAHEMEITAGFWLGQTTVTVGAWKRYRAATGKPPLPGQAFVSRTPVNEAAGDDNLPAVWIKWQDAKDYCEWGGGRLPTDAEWEYAARAGSTAARYGSLDSIAWYLDNSGKQRIDGDRFRGPHDPADYIKSIKDNGLVAHPVGQKEPNAWNLYDMLGNVTQWTADWHGSYGGRDRIVRGGSYEEISDSIRASSFYRIGGEGWDDSMGVRCAGNLP